MRRSIWTLHIDLYVKKDKLLGVASQIGQIFNQIEAIDRKHQHNAIMDLDSDTDSDSDDSLIPIVAFFALQARQLRVRQLPTPTLRSWTG